MSEQTQNEKNALRKWYEENQSNYLRGLTNNYNRMDIALPSLSLVFIYLLLWMSGKIAPNYAAMLALYCFFTSIVACLLSLVFSAKMHSDFLEQLDINYLAGDFSKQLESRWCVPLAIANFFSMALFIVGVFVLFGWIVNAWNMVG